jgi:WD40 repeat protein
MRGARTGATMSGSSERNPFVGPRPIQRGELLYGRDAEIRELYLRLQARRIVVLHSPSGAGKSSLVQAGLIPRLVAGGYDVWKTIRVNADVTGLAGVPADANRYLLSAMLSLEDELPEAHRRGPAALARLELHEYLATRPRRKGRGERPVVLIFDQFEEALTVAPLAVAAKQALFAAIGRALEAASFWALFVVREDHLAAFAPYREHIPTQLANTFRLDLLGLAGAREAAERLAAQGGRSFPAVERLVRDLSRVQVQQADGSFVAEQGQHVEPVQLQVVCRRLWDAMPAEDRSIDAEDIETYASVSAALASYYADALRAIAGDDVALERALRDWVGSKLIVGGARSQVRQDPGQSAGLGNKSIMRLLDSYLVRSEPRAGAHWFELSHDRLVLPVLQDNEAWGRAHLHPLQVQAQLWEDARRSATLLLNARALDDAQAWASEHPALLTAGEQEFLAQSRAQRARDQAARRRLLVLTAAAIGTAVVVGVLAVVAVLARGSALRAEAEARAQTARAERASLRARDASLMAGARELLTRDQPGSATRLLLAVKDPAGARGWPEVAREYLAMAIPELTLRGHLDPVYSGAWSPDGRRIVTISGDRSMRVWQADGTGEPRVFTGHAAELVLAVWSPDARRIATASRDWTVRVWDTEGADIPVILLHREQINDAAWSPDGRRIVTASDGGVAVLWGADGLGVPVELRGHGGPVRSAAWSPDGQSIVTASEDHTARVWSATDVGPSIVLAGHGAGVLSAAWSPDGRSIVTASTDRTARLWSADGSPRTTTVDLKPVVLEGHGDEVVSAAWSPDGRRIATRSRDRTVRVWDDELTLDGPLVLGHAEDVRSAVWSPDGTRIVTACLDRSAWVWAIDDPGGPVPLRSRDSVLSAAWSPDGRRILTTSRDRTLQIWRAPEASQQIVFSPDGQRLLTTASDRKLRVRRSDDTGAAIVLSDGASSVVVGAWSPDGRRVLTVIDGKIQVWQADGAAEPVLLAVGAYDLPPAPWSPDGRRILVRADDGGLLVWPADGLGEPSRVAAEILTAQWSPDGARIVTTSPYATQVWRADGGGEPLALGDRGSIAAAWSPDGARILVALLDEQVAVWPSDGGGAPLVLDGWATGDRRTAWSPDSRRVVTVLDANARVWSVDGGGESVALTLTGHTDEIRSAAWSPDGRHILTASADATARIWALDRPDKPIVLPHGQALLSATWSPDGAQVVTMTIERRGKVWPATIPALQRALERATKDCLLPTMRGTYLDEEAHEARAGFAACERSYGRVPVE